LILAVRADAVAEEAPVVLSAGVAVVARGTSHCGRASRVSLAEAIATREAMVDARIACLAVLRSANAAPGGTLVVRRAVIAVIARTRDRVFHAFAIDAFADGALVVLTTVGAARSEMFEAFTAFRIASRPPARAILRGVAHDC